jgi:hypothetical protein
MTDPAPDLLTQLLRDQSERWRRGQPLVVEGYLQRHPALARDEDSVLDLISNEIYLRCSLGQTPSLDEYRRRFPLLAAQIEIQFQLHQAVAQGDSLQPDADELPILPTAEAYRRAFATVRPQMTVNQLLLLQRHYYSPGRTTTARRLAEAVGFHDWPGCILQYALLARKVSEALDMTLDGDRLSALATCVHEPALDQGERRLVMRPQVAQALELLGWVW